MFEVAEKQWNYLTKSRESIEPYKYRNHRVSFCSAMHGYISTVNPDGSVTVRKWLVMDGNFYVKSVRSGWIPYRNQYTKVVKAALAMLKHYSKAVVVVTRLQTIGKYLVEYREHRNPSNLIKAEVLDPDQYAKDVLPLEYNGRYLGVLS